MTWALKQKLQKTLNSEQGAMVYAPGSRHGFALVYPNSYHVGMSNLGFHIIYKCINDRGDTACERLFMPEKKDMQEYIRTNTPLMTIETQRALYQFPLIGFAVSFEMDYFNMLSILFLGKVPLLATERGENDPFIIIGGPCATFNPEPLADFVDVCIVGEGEEVINELLDTYYKASDKGLSRQEILKEFSKIDGVYIPRFYEPVYQENGIIQEIKFIAGMPKQVNRRWTKELDKHPGQMVVVTSDTEFKDMFLIEVARGCGRHCRFCMAGFCFRRPRVRSLEKIAKAVAQAKQFRTKVGLVGAAISDYPQIDRLCEIILEQGMGMSVASLRADSLTEKLVKTLALSQHKTITLAPEAASDRMRRIINKGITADHIYNAVTMAIQAGIPNIRLYIMVGLPFETEEDIAAIISMAEDIKRHMESLGSKGKLTLSINPFIPKPFTPFQWLPMAHMALIEARLKTINLAFRQNKGIEVLTESLKEAYIQGILARGDRRLAKVILTAHRLGGSKAFKQGMKAAMLTEEFYLYRRRDENAEVLPWQHLNMGVSTAYLQEELRKAETEKYTSPCTANCMRCGVCNIE